MTAPGPGRKPRRRKQAQKQAKKQAKKRAKKPGRWTLAISGSRRPLIAAAAVTGLACLGVAAWFAGDYAAGPGSAPYRPVIERWASEYGVDPDLVAAVLECESSGRPRAVSSSGALGLMQLMPETARAMAKELGLPEPPRSATSLTKRDLFAPELNIRLGAYYLSKLWKRYGGDRLLAVAAYHAGPTNIDLWRSQREYGSSERFIAEVNARRTTAYVRKVMKRWERLAGE